MPKDKNSFYNGTEYARQMFVIRTEFYDQVRKMADADPRRRLKAGDVLEVLSDLARQFAGQERIDAALEKLRQNTSGDKNLRRTQNTVMTLLHSLPLEKRQKILEQIKDEST